MRNRFFVLVGSSVLVLLASSIFIWTASAASSKPVPGTVYTVDSPVDTSVGKDLTVECPANQHATGGGGYAFTSQAPTFIWMSVPTSGGSTIASQGQVAVGWRTFATFDLTVTNTWGFRAYVVCE
jgi:hypothetical protein